MTRLSCPFCGARELREFEFHKTLPEPGSDAYAHVYERANRLELSAEYWQHATGCRAWLLVRRNPSTGAVLEVQILGGSDA